MADLKLIVGLEIHVELKTKSKMFCQCSADYFGKEPNSNVCPVCLGLPGALPVPNRLALEWCIKIAKALNCKINNLTKFDRKHYMYPDLPKGYQISQYDEPVGVKGWLEYTTNTGELKKARITRVHQEEDTGKLSHVGDDSLVDFNRSGVPLVEIVTEPDFNSSEDVKAFLEELHTVIRYLEVSDADMEKGSMRLEPNISLSASEELPEYKVEVKNINSFNFVKRAVDYEVKRQTGLLEEGKTPTQETRGFDEKSMKTVSQRSKEEAHDYRYFPEPDIPPMVFEQSYIDSVRLPELPSVRRVKYQELGLKSIDAVNMVKNKNNADYFDELLQGNDIPAVKLANLILNKKISTNLSTKEFLAQAKELSTPQKTDTNELTNAIKSVLSQNQEAVKSYKNGKESVLMFLVGQVMRQMKGKADATLVKEELLNSLK